MKNNYDVVVIGLGIVGAATLWRLAPNCKRVLGIEAAGPTHCYGSSHGGSRIFRRAYWEGEKYLPLLNRADDLWRELDLYGDRQLLFPTGGVFIGPESSRVVAGSIETARKGGIEHELWNTSKIRHNLPAYNAPDEMRAVYEPGAYAISASDARLGMLNEAVRQGAVTLFGESVTTLENLESGVRLRTRNGHTYTAGAVIITTGPWIADHLMPELKTYLEPRQVPVYWFTPKNGSEHLFSHKNFPVFLYELPDGGLLYGVPSINSSEPGVKIGFHNRQQNPSIPAWKTAPVSPKSIEEISAAVAAIFPNLDCSRVRAKNCFYTVSHDESFLLGPSTRLSSVYFASACSGHGFKFAPAIGDALANLACGSQTKISISAFSPSRFEDH